MRRYHHLWLKKIISLLMIIPLSCSYGGGLVAKLDQLLQPHRLQLARLLCPWDFPGKNTGLGCPFPSPGDLPDPGTEPASPALQVVSYFASSLLLCRWILHHWATRDSLYDVAELAFKPWFACYKNILNTIFQLYFIVSDKSQLGTYVLWHKKITSRQASIPKYSAI